MNSKPPAIAVLFYGGEGFLSQEKEMINAIKIQHDNILQAYILIYLAIAELNGYLNIVLKSLRATNFPRNRKEAETEIKEASNKLVNFSMEKEGFRGLQRLNREIEIKIIFNNFIIVGLLHNQEKNLKMAIKEDKFGTRMPKALTFGRLLNEKNVCFFNFSFDIKKCSFYKDVLECNLLSNYLKHRGDKVFNRLLEVQPNLFCKYKGRGGMGREVIVHHGDLIRYAKAFKDFWMYLYDNVEKLSGDSSRKFFSDARKGLNKAQGAISHESKEFDNIIDKNHQ